jgi:hypothetical protein
VSVELNAEEVIDVEEGKVDCVGLSAEEGEESSAQVRGVRFPMIDATTGKIVNVSPKARAGVSGLNRQKVAQSDEFLMDRILADRDSGKALQSAGVEKGSTSQAGARTKYLQAREHSRRHPKLGEYHLLGSREYVECALELDADFADECVVSDLDVIESEVSNSVQFEIPQAMLAGETDSCKKFSYDSSVDISKLLGFSESTMEYIVNYGMYNGHLDNYNLDSFAGIKERFRRDGHGFLRVVREILDSGASHSMSGDSRRLKAKEAVDLAIRGFNDSRSAAESKGVNEDGMMELYIPSMPEDLVLLCLHDYAKKGCVYLSGVGGRVLQLTPTQREALERYLSSFPSVLELEVQNGVYVVSGRPGDNYEPHRQAVLAEEAYWSGVSYRAGLYFNGKVNYNTVSERILGLMMSGLSFGAIRSALKHQSIGGVHPDITLEALIRYERDHGRSPDVTQMALAHQPGNVKAFDKQKEKLERRGQRIEFDAFAWDTNDRSGGQAKKESMSRAEREQEDLLEADEMGVYSERKRVDKLRERGGADHAEIFMDCYSGKVFGVLRKPGTRALDSVKDCVRILQGLNVKIEKFAADSGFISNSEYRVFTSEVIAHLLECGIEIERAEAYNHSIGTAFIENMVKLIKQLMRQAYRYVECNENIKKLRFKELDILKLWGEIFHWAINVINLYPSPRVEGKTREEAFSGVKPNIQHTRLLPIFSTVMIWRGPQKGRKFGKGEGNGKYRNYYDKPSYVYGLYVGFETTTPGSIRVAVKTDKGIKVISTSKYKGVSEGGGVDVEAEVQRAADRMMTDHVEIRLPSDDIVDVESTEATAVVDEDAPGDLDESKGDERVSFKETSIIGESADQHLERGSVSENWEPDDQDIARELQEERGLEMTNRNRLVYHDRSEYNPIHHPGRNERAARRSKAALGLYSSLLREGWLVHAEAQMAIELAGVEINRDLVYASEDLIDMVNLASLDSVATASEHRRDVIEAMSVFQEKAGSGYFTDWTNFTGIECYFADLLDGCFIKFGEVPEGYQHVEIEGFRVVTENVPRNFGEALKSPIWGASARKELNDLLEKAMIRVPAEVALEAIANGSDCLTLFPVFESKIRDGVLVHKVRLVADGRRHETAGPTYSSTPSREEFLMFIDMIARREWEWCHVDENRAFLNADRIDQIPLFARLKGEKDWFQIVRALYGLKTSTRDHSICAAVRLEKLGFVRRGMCTNIFEKITVAEDGTVHHVLVYQYVDDYFFAGNSKLAVEISVAGFRSVVGTSEPAYDPDKGLGMEFVRDRKARTISITMTATIQRMYDEFVLEADKLKAIDLPIPKGKYIAEKVEFDRLEAEGDTDAVKVDSLGRSLYMKQVGAILWVSGIRFDINLSTVYLTWFTHEPRKHHLLLSERVIRYLGQTKDVPLVLGGHEAAQITTLSDCSLGTGPKGRSVIAYGTRMSEKSGFIAVKVKATQYMALSSFEGEINGYFESFRTSAKFANIAKELSYPVEPMRVIVGDNEKAIQFIRGEAEGKGIRHALRRFSYMREEFLKGSIDLIWQSGKELVVDAMTKIVDVESFKRFRGDVLGHGLLNGKI